MKKIVGLLVVACLTFCVIPAKAQFKFGIKGGVNISTVKFNSDVLNSDNTTGFQIGPMIEATVPLLGMGFDLGVLYSKKGMDFDSENISCDFIEIPLNLKWKMELPLIKPYIAAGPYIGFRVGGDKVWETTKAQIEAKIFSAGLNFGAGVEVLSHFQVGFNYGLGLTNDFTAEPIKVGSFTEGEGKNRGWSITAAILF